MGLQPRGHLLAILLTVCAVVDSSCSNPPPGVVCSPPVLVGNFYAPYGYAGRKIDIYATDANGNENGTSIEYGQLLKFSFTGVSWLVGDTVKFSVVDTDALIPLPLLTESIPYSAGDQFAVLVGPKTKSQFNVDYDPPPSLVYAQKLTSGSIGAWPHFLVNFAPGKDDFVDNQPEARFNFQTEGGENFFYGVPFGEQKTVETINSGWDSVNSFGVRLGDTAEICTQYANVNSFTYPTAVVYGNGLQAAASMQVISYPAFQGPAPAECFPADVEGTPVESNTTMTIIIVAVAVLVCLLLMAVILVFARKKSPPKDKRLGGNPEEELQLTAV